MHLEINDHTIIGDIQKVFSNYYPFLSIAFYTTPHQKYEGSDKKSLVRSDITIGQIKKTHISTLIEIKPGNSAAKVEIYY